VPLADVCVVAAVEEVFVDVAMTTEVEVVVIALGLVCGGGGAILRGSAVGEVVVEVAAPPLGEGLGALGVTVTVVTAVAVVVVVPVELLPVAVVVAEAEGVVALVEVVTVVETAMFCALVVVEMAVEVVAACVVVVVVDAGATLGFGFTPNARPNALPTLAIVLKLQNSQTIREKYV